MSYISLYRKWRPQVFADVVGQEHVTRTILNALKTGQLLSRLPFQRTPGTGKTTMAKLLAKAVSIVRMRTHWSLAISVQAAKASPLAIPWIVMEIDGASNRGIDQMRELRDKIGFAPVEGKFKVYIIDGSSYAYNRSIQCSAEDFRRAAQITCSLFLPLQSPQGTYTILSRCQVFLVSTASVQIKSSKDSRP